MVYSSAGAQILTPGSSNSLWNFSTEIVRKESSLKTFAHDLEFTNVVMSARWKDCTGKIQQVVRKSLLSLD